MESKIYEDYCTGCGLCQSFLNAELVKDEHGFENIKIGKDENLLKFCKETCPANGIHLLKEDSSTWGHYVSVYDAFACNDKIRFNSSSGGVTTAVAIFLLNKGYVDGVIQVGLDENDPFNTKIYCNQSAESVEKCCGSRYITSKPLNNIISYLETGNKYAFVGRPCDVVTLNNFLENNQQYKNSIYCTLTFFCAGAPSRRASEKLSKHLNVNAENCKQIRYRGNGWPGEATVTNKEGKSFSMPYIESWDRILGRDVRKICKFCTDGIGEMADISSGDLWYLSEDLKPIFDEKPGRNVTFARTSLGEKILKEAREEGYIDLSDYSKKINELDYIQPYHAIRRKTMYAKIAAMKTMGKVVPNYPNSVLKNYSKPRTFKQNFRTYLGTIHRILKGKI